MCLRRTCRLAAGLWPWATGLRREHGGAQGGEFQAHVADAVAEGLEPLLGPAEPAHEFAVVGLA